MPRLTPITSKSQLAPEHQAAADAVMQVFGHIRGPFSMLLHSPQLAQLLVPMVTFVREKTVIEPQLRFAAILATARERDAAYVWAAQVEQARKNGISDALIDKVRSKSDLAQLGAEERDVVNYVRQLMRTNRVDQATFDALRSKHDERWMIELTGIVNFFGFVSGICNAFEVPVPEGGDKL